ncbi:MAG: hypothetical protein AAGA85_00350, partial [Bacteroidota bacterium]
MKNWKEANEAINNALEKGTAMVAFEEYYSNEVVIQENEAEPREGKSLNREQCGAFVSMFP